LGKTVLKLLFGFERMMWRTLKVCHIFPSLSKYDMIYPKEFLEITPKDYTFALP